MEQIQRLHIVFWVASFKSLFFHTMCRVLRDLIIEEEARDVDISSAIGTKQIWIEHGHRKWLDQNKGWK